MYTRKNSLPLTSCPIDEDGAQVQSDGSTYDDLKREATQFCELLQKKFPAYQKYNCRFRVKRCNHDFGTYFDVEVIYTEPDFDEDINDSTEFAFFVESNLPRTWEDTKVMHFEPDTEAVEF